MNKISAQNHRAADQAANPIVSPNQYVCQLTGPELAKRKAKLQEEVFSQVKQITEVENGYVFHFADDDDFLLKLMDYMLAEKKCCAFFQFDLSVKAHGGGIDWKISGPAEAKEMLRLLVEDVGK
ncbi:hypothetical protein QQ020_22530 [Fulvivirgaceae bacterium BMA12]|uniref:Uncharacterized protein n=1 Tax=Agaribacillus aureus TaxID=3051825 RepID=A0ABT8LAT8_9BACT|nr:hypothetical protein [Fulvivirgaceae bacterium BMA12]